MNYSHNIMWLWKVVGQWMLIGVFLLLLFGNGSGNLENVAASVPSEERWRGRAKCPYSPKDWFLQAHWKHSHRMMMLGSCSFQMGTASPHAIPGDEEEEREVVLSHVFWIDKTEVSLEQFSHFVQKTNYTTVAEFLGTSFIFHLEVDNLKVEKSKRGWWWLEKAGVSWRSNSQDVTFKRTAGNSHPVVHVTYDDARAYCLWKGGRLPTEAEWEFACRGDSDTLFPWGDQLHPNGTTHMTNIWQGQFPHRNTEKDGFLLTAPVTSFPPNSFGLYDLIGNVWEWVEGPWDWRRKGLLQGGPSQFNPNVRVQKGGSFLCHRKHCFRYRCGARTKGTRDSTASNLGFRCAADATSPIPK